MFPDAPCNFYPGHEGHRVVDNGNVGSFFYCSCDRLLAIACLGNDLLAGVVFQHGTQPGSHRFVIVSDKNPFHDRGNLRAASRLPSTSHRSLPDLVALPACLEHYA